MKKILLIIFSILLTLGYGQIRVPATIVQNDSADTYPVALTEDLQGTIKHVQSYADLFNINPDVMVLGLMATVADSAFDIYTLTRMDTITWEPYNSGNTILTYITVEDTTRWGDTTDLNYDGTRTVSNKDLAAYGTVIGGSTVIEFLDNYYFSDEPPGASLSVSGTNTLEYGLSGGDLNRTLNWTATKKTNTIASVVVNSVTQSITGLTQSGTQAVTLTANQTNTYVMTVTDSKGLFASNSASWYFRHGYYWGSMADVTTVTDADIMALDGAGISPGKLLTTTRVKEFNGINGAGEYLVFAFPVSWGVPTFIINGLTSTAWTKVRSNAFVNTNGYSETYQVWVSNSQQSTAIAKFKIE